jgi:hypothetical protein
MRSDKLIKSDAIPVMPRTAELLLTTGTPRTSPVPGIGSSDAEAIAQWQTLLAVMHYEPGCRGGVPLDPKYHNPLS